MGENIRKCGLCKELSQVKFGKVNGRAKESEACYDERRKVTRRSEKKREN